MSAGTSEVIGVLMPDSAPGDTFTMDNIVVQELTLWQPGMDWLGPELVTNGNFSNGSAGWSASGTNAQISVSSGQMTVTNGAAAEAGAVPAGSTVQIGRTYAVSCSRVGGSAGGFVVLGAQNLPINGVPGIKTGVLGPITGATGIRVATGTATLNDAVTFDDLSIREQLYTLMNVLLPANVPRIAYDPVTGACLGALREPQRTNLIWNSTKLDVLGGYDAGTFFTNVASVLAPDGSTNAWRLTPGITAAPSQAGSANNGNRVFVEVGTANGTYATSIWVKSDAIATDFSIMVLDKGSDTVRTRVDVVSTGAWTRVAAVGTTTGVSVGTRVLIATRHPVLVFGWQAELGTESSSYIPTSGAAATRAADDSQPQLQNILAASGTLVVECVQPKVPDRFPGFALKGTGGNSNVLGVYVNGGAGGALTGFAVLARTAGVGVFEQYLGDVVAQGAIKKIAIAWSGGRVWAVQNGGAVVSASGLTLPAVNRFDLGSLDDVLGVGSSLRARIYPRAMAPAELQAVTK